MIRVTFYFVFALTIVAIAGCTKNSNEKTPALSAAEILTAKPWRLLSYGFDSNKNGSVDGNEEAIKACEMDNTYTFNKGGSGIVNENSSICAGSDPSRQFIWALKNNNTLLDFYFGAAYIVKISKDILYLSDSNSDQARLLFIYGH